MTYVPGDEDKIRGFSPTKGHADSEDQQVHDTSFRESILELQAAFSVFQKISYALGAFILAVIAWAGASIQSLQSDRTRNADHIESLQRELGEFKTYESGLKASEEQNISAERAILAQIQIDITTLKTRFEIHEHQDESELNKRQRETRTTP